MGLSEIERYLESVERDWRVLEFVEVFGVCGGFWRCWSLWGVLKVV